MTAPRPERVAPATDAPGSSTGTGGGHGAGNRRTLTAILGSITAMGITMGLTFPLFSVVLDRMGLDAALVGLSLSIQVGAALVIGPFVPWLLARIGAVPLMFWGIGCAAIAILVAGHIDEVWLWFVIRFLVGAGMAVHWILSETWLNRVVSDFNRGFVAGIYQALVGLGFAIGPLILGLTGSESFAPYAIATAVILAGAVPLLWIRADAPVMTHQQGQTTLSVLRFAPVIMLAAVISGFVDNATVGLLPVYGLRLGMSEAAAVLQIAIATIGAVLLQLPIGWLGDRIGRRKTLVACAIVKTVGVLLLPLVVYTPWLLWPVLFIWGGAMVAFYTLALALLGSTFRGDTLAKASSTLVMTYCVGSIVGPTVVGATMDLMGPHGFVVGMAVASGMLVLVGLLRVKAERF